MRSARLSVCMSLSVREHISGTAGLIFTKCFVQIPCGRDSVLLWWRCDMYVLPVVWMTSRLTVMGRMAKRCHPGAESDVYECLVIVIVNCAFAFRFGSLLPVAALAFTEWATIIVKFFLFNFPFQLSLIYHCQRFARITNIGPNKSILIFASNINTISSIPLTFPYVFKNFEIRDRLDS